MSAAQPHALPYTEQPLNEAEALYRIGHQAVVASNLEATVESILALGLRVAGVTGTAIEPLPGYGWPYRQVDTASTSAPPGTAVADIAAGGRNWGTIRIYFSLSQNGLESPLRFTRFIGQQIGIVLSRIELLNKREAAERTFAALERRLLTYKRVQRAKGILAQKLAVSEQEALHWIRRSARSARRSLIEVSEAIIFLETDERPRYPRSRRQLPVAKRRHSSMGTGETTQASTSDTRRSLARYRNPAALQEDAMTEIDMGLLRILICRS
jgi:hypothetical protein